MQSKTLLFVLVLIILVFILGMYSLRGRPKTQELLPSSPIPTATQSSLSPAASPTPTNNPIPTGNLNNRQNQTSCNSNSDCQSGESCRVIGPIIANQPVRKVCVPENQVSPL